METQDIKRSSFDDIVFEGRNKGYGAYQLRRLEARDILIALLIGSFLLALLIFGPLIWGKYFGEKKSNKNNKPKEQTALAVLKPSKKKENRPQPKREVVKVELHKFIQYKPREDNEVQEKDPPPDDSLLNRNIGRVDQQGLNEPYIDPPGTGGNDDEYKEDEIFTYVDEDPQFKEGEFRLFIEKNYAFTEKMYAKGKAGTIYVTFILEKDGTVNNVQVLKSKGLTPEQDAEAIRVIKLSAGKWIPAKVNGDPVRMHFMQKFTFNEELFY